VLVNLADRRADFLNKARVNSLGQKIPRSIIFVRKIEASNMINHPAIQLFWHIVIKRAVACFHVTQRKVHSLCDDGSNAGVGVSQGHHSV
jgi:hypothetical protein